MTPQLATLYETQNLESGVAMNMDTLSDPLIVEDKDWKQGKTKISFFEVFILFLTSDMAGKNRTSFLKISQSVFFF